MHCIVAVYHFIIFAFFSSLFHLLSADCLRVRRRVRVRIRIRVRVRVYDVSVQCSAVVRTDDGIESLTR